MSAPREPTTGLHVVHVIPETWGPFVDILASYRNVAARCFPWMNVVSPEVFAGMKSSPAYQDPGVLFVLWTDDPRPGPKTERKALVAGVYSEAIGERNEAGELLGMLPEHRAHFERFRAVQAEYDAVFAHTPWMQEQLAYLLEPPVYVVPVGWDPETMGRPRWTAPKFVDYAYYGSGVGKRSMILPFLQGRLGKRLVDVTGSFGRDLLGKLDVARASLYVAHSDVRSFSTWRIWQTIATSAALVAEVGTDTWPLHTAHYVGYPRVTLDNGEETANELRRILDHVDLLGMARRCYEEVAGAFTVETIVQSYLLDAMGDLVRRHHLGA